MCIQAGEASSYIELASWRFAWGISVEGVHLEGL